ncbi:diacylglycerol O-acyltransferase 2 [Achlya hypogyna]|uniref:Acyltransferase n=1 Tax=Achlya hypogyna TaxID=1202772 RepID=A0A1V9Z207_ACHHY|nr:diacylglycerol O-acyltransferase 2 [Achlya hypogyna]
MATLLQKSFISFIFLIFPCFVGMLAIAAMLAPPYGALVVAALFVHSNFFDRAAYNGKGRVFRFLRTSWLWEYARLYFPHTLHQEEELDASKPHFFIAHPHGIIGMSVWMSFGGDSIHISRKNKDMDIALATVGINFRMPLWKDLLLGLGFVDASFSSMSNVLRRGRSACLVVGGAQEALESYPGSNRLVLNRRKGFVRLALQQGVPLVPVYTFGETDLYTQLANPIGSILRAVQEKLMKKFTFSMPILTSGPLPKATKLHTVIGAPVPVPRREVPTQAEIDEYHAKYITAVTALFEKHQAAFYDGKAGSELKIVL